MKKFIKNTILLTIIGYVLPLKAMDFYELREEQCYSLGNRSLLIFLDTTHEVSREGFGPVTSNLITALKQQVAPILASTSLVNNVFNNQKYSEISNALAFNPHEWIIKKVNQGLYVFIPFAYCQRHAIDASLADVYSSEDESSNLELVLGLKINHMSLVIFDEMLEEQFSINEDFNNDYFSNELCNQDTQKSSIFCTYVDYKNKNITLPIWSLYLVGHGAFRKNIATIPLDSFRKALDFFSYNITTKILIYVSCYAAGINTDIVYKKPHSSVQKLYPFAIITNALTDATTRGKNISLNQFEEIDVLCNFENFIKETESCDFFDYQSVVKSVLIERPSFYQGTPQIKLPGLEWFFVLDVNNQVASIGSVLAKTRDADKEMSLARFFNNNNLKVLLLYAQNIPFELFVDTQEIEAIISMVPGDAIHVLTGLNSVKSINATLDLFMSIKKLAPRKIFYIKKIESFHPNQLKELEDVIIYNENGCSLAFFTFNNRCCFKKFKKKPDRANHKGIDVYNNFLDEVKVFLSLRISDPGALLPMLASFNDIKEIKRSIDLRQGY